MENENALKPEQKSPNPLRFILFRIIVAVLLLGSLLFVKYLFPKSFKDVKKEYNRTFGVDMSAEAQLNPEV